MLLIVIKNLFLPWIACFLPLIFSISIGTLFFCAKKKPDHKPRGSSVLKKNDSEKPNQSSLAELPKTEKSKSKQIDSKQKKSQKRDPSPPPNAPAKAQGGGKTDPFEGGDQDDEAVGVGGTENSQKCVSKSKKRGGKGKLGMPNKDGYDDLNPNKKDEEDAKSKMKTEETKSKMQQKDDGYDAIDPTKNVNLENVNMKDAKGAAASKQQPNKPRQIPRDAKQQKIAKGAKKGKGDYPTFDDVVSDWDSKKETAGTGGGESKVKRPSKKSTTVTENSEKEEKFQLKSREKITEKTQQNSNTNNINNL